MLKQISFDQISPYVRYIGHRGIDQDRRDRWILARDNRLFWCTAGKGTILLENSELMVSEGQIVFIPAGTPFFFHPDPEHQQAFLSVNFDFLYNDSLGRKELGTVKVSRENIEDIPRYVFSDCPRLNEAFVTACEEDIGILLHQAQKCFFYREPFYQPEINAGVMIVIMRLLRHLAAESSKQPNRSETIDRVIDYIRKHYAEKLTAEEVARHIGYHPDYINRLMRQHTGQTMFQYLQEFRISKAIRLILSTEQPFSSIAEQTGFIDASHFSRIFHKTVGKTPREFRAK